MTKKTRIKMDRGTLHVNISAESVFRRALTLSSTREDITTKKLLSLPIGPVPTALFHDDGTMRKCTKADLIHKLEEPVGRCIELPEFDACRTVMIRDVMAVIQALPVQQYHSFDDLAHNFPKVMCAGFTTANTIVDVFDRYDVDQSLKWEERQRRAAGIGQRVYQVTGARAIPPWKNFLSVSLNKLALQHFLTEFIVTHAAEQLANTNYKLYVAGGFPQGEHTKSVTAQGVTEEHLLYCTQEEADSRIFLHAKHTDDMFQQHGINGRIIIKSPDTDVIVLAIYYFSQFEHIQEMWVHAGSVTSITDHMRYNPIHEICRSLSPVLSRILPALHALSGCDTTSSFYGIGKRSVFKIVHEKPDEFADLSTLSEDDETVAIDASRRLVLKLYSTHKTHGQNLDELRLKLASKKDPSLSRLPPCEKSFLQHVKRARWQCKVWTNSHVAKPDIGSPLTHGWKKDTDNHLSPMYYEGPMASEVIEGLLCNCKARGRCSSNCSCSGQGLPCTELCPCGGSDCKNPLTQASERPMDDEDD